MMKKEQNERGREYRKGRKNEKEIIRTKKKQERGKDGKEEN